MRRSTNSLIAEQCNIINRDGVKPAGQKRRIHNILTEQISSLNNSGSLTLSETITGSPSLGAVDAYPVARAERAKRPAARATRKAAPAQGKESDASFLQLLTGHAVAEGGAVLSAQSRCLVFTKLSMLCRLRQQIAQTHVMKCLGGFKYLEGNGYDNFVVATLPRLDHQNNLKST